MVWLARNRGCRGARASRVLGGPGCRGEITDTWCAAPVTLLASLEGG